MPQSDKIFTYTLTSAILTIIADYGITKIAFRLLSGTVTVTGTMKIGSISSSALTLTTDNPLAISDDEPIESLVIDATSGSVEIIASK